MLQPKRTKYRKFQKGTIQGTKGNLGTLSFGKYGIKSLIAARLSARVIETVRRTFTRHFKRSGQVWIRVFPDIAISQKPTEVRMGKGKGAPAYWVCKVKAGQILFEMDGIPLEVAKRASVLASHKLPFPIRFVAE